MLCCENFVIILYFMEGIMKNNSNFNITIGELLWFLAIIWLSYSHSLPSKQEFWSIHPNLGVPIVSEL